MKQDPFWDLIQASRSYAHVSDGYRKQIEYLIQTLAQKSVQEIIEFEKKLQDLLIEADTESLRDAFEKILEGGSDDRFEYAKCWLIAKGQELYEKVIHESDPSELLEFIALEQTPQLEELLGVASQAYQMKTGLDNFYDLLME